MDVLPTARPAESPICGISLPHVSGNLTLLLNLYNAHMYAEIARSVSVSRSLSMPENGDISPVFGLYRSLCCNREIVIREGDIFPDCPSHRNLSTVWKLVKAEVVPAKEAKKKDNSAAL